MKRCSQPLRHSTATSMGRPVLWVTAANVTKIVEATGKDIAHGRAGQGAEAVRTLPTYVDLHTACAAQSPSSPMLPMLREKEPSEDTSDMLAR